MPTEDDNFGFGIPAKPIHQIRHRVYIAADGSWGDAPSLRIVELDDQQLEHLNDLVDKDAIEFLNSLPVSKQID